ncbi:DUF1149 family protein [Agrilactobacillus yilanensis]|uniref:DUF1149 family protein n=1 Tax=Agrilactobacillus yilanensis TaxID=2485997 RepID=A0ABW4JAN0_9LACO|nr:DUF1149 family protein [Agrilactobacillus yilanensis]
MKSNKFPIIVKNFHYDLLDSAEVQGNQNIQVSIQEVVPKGEADKQAEQGQFFEISVPFDVTPPEEMFHVSGLISRYIQIIDFHGHASDLDPEALERFSRPLVEYIETLTYSITSVALNRGVQLNFHAAPSDDDDEDEDY